MAHISNEMELGYGMEERGEQAEMDKVAYSKQCLNNAFVLVTSQ